jgi:hypothetical protein
MGWCDREPCVGISLYYNAMQDEAFDLDRLDEDDPFEIDRQAAHLFRHGSLGVEDILELWESEPPFYPAIRPAHWLMVGEVGGRVLVVPLAPSTHGDRERCRPIGCYEAPPRLAQQYRSDREDR